MNVRARAVLAVLALVGPTCLPAEATELRSRLARADDLLASGSTSEALTEYLWCFDHGSEDMGFYGVRMTEVVPRLGELARASTDARAALLSRRGSAEARLLRPEVDAGDGWRLAADIVALDEALGVPSRSLGTYDALVERRPADDGTRQLFFNLVFELLIEAKRYDDVVEHGGDLEMRLIDELFLYARTADLLTTGRAGDEDRIAPLRDRAVEQGARYYEALLGAGRREQAKSVAELLIDFDDSLTTHSRLRDHAVRAGAAEPPPLAAVP